VAKKLMELAKEKKRRQRAEDLMGTSQFNFMLTSRRCKCAMVERFGRMGCVALEKERTLYRPYVTSPWFVASPWFIAYLVRCSQFYVKDIYAGEDSLDFGRSMVPRNDGDPQDIGAIDALTYVLGLEDKEPGLSECQVWDIRPLYANLNYHGDTIEGLNWLLALRSKKCEIYLHEPMPTAKNDEVPRVLSYPEIQTVVVHAPSRRKKDGGPLGEWETDFGDLGNFGVWVRLLSHLMNSCPNLKQLDIIATRYLTSPHLREVNFDRMGEFMRHVFPQLPQESKVRVNVVFGLDVATLSAVQTLLANNREAIYRNFKEEVPKDKHITIGKYQTRIFPLQVVYLCRVTRWDRVGGGQQMEEGVEPWWVMLQIDAIPYL